MSKCRDMTNIPKFPGAEIYETDDALYFNLKIPGMETKDLDIQVSEEAVFIVGERKSRTKKEAKGNTRSEFYYDKYQCIIPLNTKIQNADIIAEYKNLILNLTLPKSDSQQNKVVKINLGKVAT